METQIKLVRSVFELEEDRIIELPRVNYVEIASKFDKVEEALRLEGAPRKISLNMYQKAALLAVATAKGAVVTLGVGKGKTFIALLAGSLLDVDNVVILTNAPAVQQMMKERDRLAKEYALKRCSIMSIGAIQTRGGDEKLLRQLAIGSDGVLPGNKLLVIDEAHQLGNSKSARTRRVFRIVQELSKRIRVYVLPLSGTLLNNPIDKMYHLFALSLRENSPLPIVPHVAKVWGNVLDHGAEPTTAEVLKLIKVVKLGNPDFSIKRDLKKTGVIRNAVFKHLSGVRGVVRSGLDDEIGASITLTRVTACKAFSDSALSEVYATVSETKAIPIKLLGITDDKILSELDGVDSLQIGSPTDVARVLAQLSLGFTYIYTGFGEHKARWMFARNQWKRAVRYELENKASANYDTELLVHNRVAKRILHGDTVSSEDKELFECFKEWADVEELETPVKTPIWVDDSVIKAYFKLAEEYKYKIALEISDRHARQGHCSMWYKHRALAEKLAELGATVFVSGQVVPTNAGAGRVSAFSTKAHSVALNLQHLSQAIVIEAPSSAEAFQQLFGRFLREGQLADEVRFIVAAHTPTLAKKLTSASDAAKTNQQKGEQQYLLLATREDIKI